VTQHDKADVTDIEALPHAVRPQAEKAGGKLTMTAIALRSSPAAMKRFPQSNASVDMARAGDVYRKSIHIGVAVDTERGLPRAGHPRRRSQGHRRARRRAGQRVREGAAPASCRSTRCGRWDDDHETSAGIGGTSFTPIVNGPEVAILGGVAPARTSPCGARRPMTKREDSSRA